MTEKTAIVLSPSMLGLYFMLSSFSREWIYIGQESKSQQHIAQPHILWVSSHYKNIFGIVPTRNYYLWSFQAWDSVCRRELPIAGPHIMEFWARLMTEVRFQPVNATHAFNLAACVSNPKVFLGRSFSRRATVLSLACECTDKSVPFGKYCRSNPLVFSSEPRCQWLWGSQK